MVVDFTFKEGQQKEEEEQPSTLRGGQSSHIKCNFIGLNLHFTLNKQRRCLYGNFEPFFTEGQVLFLLLNNVTLLCYDKVSVL